MKYVHSFENLLLWDSQNNLLFVSVTNGSVSVGEILFQQMQSQSHIGHRIFISMIKANRMLKRKRAGTMGKESSR